MQKTPSQVINIDDEKHQHYTLSVLLLDNAIKALIKNGKLIKDDLVDALETAKDELLELNKDNPDNQTKLSIVLTVNDLQTRYLEVE